MTKIIQKILKFLLILAILINCLFFDQSLIISPEINEVEAETRFKDLALEVPAVSRYFQGQQGTMVVMVKKDGQPVSGAKVTADYYKPDNTIFLSNQVFTELIAGSGIYYHNFNIPSNADLGVYKVKIKAVSTTTPDTFLENFDDGDAAGWTPTGGTWVVESGAYKQTSKDLTWHRSITGTSTWENYTYSADVRLDASTSTQWIASTTLSSGLGDIGEHAAPEAFQMGSVWYLISGESDGGFFGYEWIGSGWVTNNSIVAGLATSTDLQTKPTIFQMDGTWYLIHGDYWSGSFTGYSWTGTTWQSTSTITNGLTSIGYGSAPEVFQKNSTWYLISGAKDGKFYGFKWSTTTLAWEADTSIVSGLGDIGITSAPEVFQMDGTWYLISGEYDGDFHGFYWTGTEWASSNDIISALEATTYSWGHTKPTVFQMGSIWCLIAGEYDGSFNGYDWGEETGEWGHYAGITFRYTDPDSNYEFHLIEDGSNSRVGLRKNGSLIAMSDPGSVTISPNTWYELKIEINEDRIKSYVDDSLKIDYYDPVPLTQGKIGLITYDTRASFDNINVSIGTATSTAYLSHDFKVESQADYVSSLQKEWHVYLSDFGEITQDDYYLAKLFILDYQSNPTDPFSTPTISIWNATPTQVVFDEEMTRVATGTFEFSYYVATSTPFGVWETVASVEVEPGKVIKANDYWEVEGSPAQVIINAIVDNSVPTITADVTISNEGNAGYEYKYEWCVVDSEWNACGGGDDVFYSSASKYIEAYTDWNTLLDANVPNPGDYWFKVVVYWGTEQSGASMTFTAVVAFIPKSQNWRWYLDEDKETPGYPLAAENQAPTYLLSGETIKLRMTIKETSGNTGEDIKMRLQYSTSSDFSTNVYFLPEIWACGATDHWCYGDGVDSDNDPILNLILSDSNATATHNELGTSTTAYDLLANAAAEWEFTIKNNNAATGTTYYFRAYDNTNDAPVPKNEGESYPSIVPGTASLSFDVAGLPEGVATEGVITNASTTITTVPFGELVFATSTIGAQRLTVSTNAPQGYQILVFGRENLISDTGNIINPILGTNESPVTWSVATSSAYGYHAGDDTLSDIGNGPSRFAPDDTYARFEAIPKEIAYSSIPVINESIDLIFRIEVTELQVPGEYSSEVVYIVMPTY